MPLTYTFAYTIKKFQVILDHHGRDRGRRGNLLGPLELDTVLRQPHRGFLAKGLQELGKPFSRCHWMLQ